MKKERIESHFDSYDSQDELTSADRQLLSTAMEAAASAYAPYSAFKVGAAVLLANNKVITGSNQENAAYPSGLCAERVAVFHAASSHPGIIIKAIAVAAFSNDENKTFPVSPCGNCRQVLAEYEYRYRSDIRFIMEAGGQKIIIAPSIRSLLPFMFSPDSLKNKSQVK